MTAFLFMYIAKGSALLPLAYCILNRNRKNKVITMIFILLFISLITEVIVEFHVQAGRRASLYINFYTLLEFIVISLLYTHLIPHWKKAIRTIAILYGIFFIANSIWIENIKRIQDYPLLIESGIVIVYSLAYFKYLFKTLSHDPPILRNGQFWIAIAFSAYFTYNIGLFAMANYIFTKLEPDTARAIWNVHNANYIIRNIILTWGIYCIAKANPAYRERFGMQENWRDSMPPNPHLQAFNEEDNK